MTHGFRRGQPFAHGMWVLLGIFLNRLWRATVGVTFPQDRVHGTALHDIVFFLNGFFVVGLRIIWIVRKRVAFLLQFGNGGLELRDGRGNVSSLITLALGIFTNSPSSVRSSD